MIPPPPIQISFIIPVAEDSFAFRRLLKSLEHLGGGPVELIFQIDGPAILPTPPKLPFQVHIQRLAQRSGPARARNAAALKARGEWLCFLDADVSLPSDFVAQSLSLPDAFPSYDAFIGSYNDQPGDAGLISQYRNLLHHYVHQRGNEEAATFWGACGMVRRDVFMGSGGFHPDFSRPSVEDIELGYRLKAGGARIRLVKDWQVCHEKRWTLGNMVRTDIFQRALPWLGLLHQFGYWQRKDLNLDRRSRLSGLLVSGAWLALFLSPLWIGLLGPGFILLGIVIWLNHDIFRFFARVHSFRMMVLAVPLQLLYYSYSSMAVAWFMGLRVFRSKPPFVPSPASTYGGV